MGGPKGDGFGPMAAAARVLGWEKARVEAAEQVGATTTSLWGAKDAGLRLLLLLRRAGGGGDLVVGESGMR